MVNGEEMTTLLGAVSLIEPGDAIAVEKESTNGAGSEAHMPPLVYNNRWIMQYYNMSLSNFFVIV